jgi:hypothetical protein
VKTTVVLRMSLTHFNARLDGSALFSTLLPKVRTHNPSEILVPALSSKATPEPLCGSTGPSRASRLVGSRSFGTLMTGGFQKVLEEEAGALQLTRTGAQRADAENYKTGSDHKSNGH